MLNKAIINFIPKADSFDSESDTINYISKTINSSTIKPTNSKIDESRWSFIEKPVICQYFFTGTNITANVVIPFNKKIMDNRNNCSMTATWSFTSPSRSMYDFIIYGATAGATVGNWIARETKIGGQVIDHVIGSTSDSSSSTRCILLDAGSKIFILNTTTRTIVKYGTAGYNDLSITISQRGI